MGQITQSDEIALVLLLLAGVSLGIWKTGQILAQVDRIPARNGNASLQRLVATGQFTLAGYLPHPQGTRLWHLIVETVLFAGLTLLGLYVTGMIPLQ